MVVPYYLLVYQVDKKKYNRISRLLCGFVMKPKNESEFLCKECFEELEEKFILTKGGHKFCTNHIKILNFVENSIECSYCGTFLSKNDYQLGKLKDNKEQPFMHIEINENAEKEVTEFFVIYS